MLIPDQYLHGEKRTCEIRGKKQDDPFLKHQRHAWLKQMQENHSQWQLMKFNASAPYFEQASAQKHTQKSSQTQFKSSLKPLHSSGKSQTKDTYSLLGQIDPLSPEQTRLGQSESHGLSITLDYDIIALTIC